MPEDFRRRLASLPPEVLAALHALFSDHETVRFLRSPEFAECRPFRSSAHWRATIWQDIGTDPSDILVHTEASRVTATINRDAFPAVREERDGRAVRVLDPYARLPRVLDRVGSNRPRDRVIPDPCSAFWPSPPDRSYRCNPRFPR